MTLNCGHTLHTNFVLHLQFVERVWKGCWLPCSTKFAKSKSAHNKWAFLGPLRHMKMDELDQWSCMFMIHFHFNEWGFSKPLGHFMDELGQYILYFLNDLNEHVVASCITYDHRWIKARMCIYFDQMESISPYFHYHKIYVQRMHVIG